jgi:hypothetical protein
MGKGKYKRKRQHAHTSAQQQPAQVEHNEQEKITTRDETQAATTTERKGDKKMKHPRLHKFYEWIKRDSKFTDWCVAGFTFVLAVVAIYQFVVMNGQLDTMRKDQRPWIKIAFVQDKLTALAPLGGTIRLVNNGKTPAKGIIRGDFAVEIVQNGDQPKLDYPWPHTRFTTGMIMPNDAPNDLAVYRVRAEHNASGWVPDNLTLTEFNDFTAFKTFIVVYGTVHYSDFFGTDHWTKFCTPLVPERATGNFTFQPCSDYGNVDDK